MCSNTYLSSLLNEFKCFVGVFSCDNLPLIKANGEDLKSIIINTNKSGVMFGGHWLLLTLYFKKNNLVYCELFDSLGLDKQGIPLILRDYIRSFKVKVKYLSTQLQSMSSDFCGLYCVCRFLSNILSESKVQFIKHFNLSSLKSNDKIVVRLIFNYFNKING